MKIIYKQGDLLQCEERWILHGCNAQGKMGSGVAKAIRAKYPSAYTTYMWQYEHELNMLGTVTFAEQDDGKIIFNGITQEFYGNDGGQYVSYEAISDVIWSINDSAAEYCTQGDVIKVAMPMIGAGLGGGNWDTISEIIEQYSTHFQPVVYTL